LGVKNMLTDEQLEKLPFGHCRNCGKKGTSINNVFCDQCNWEMAHERYRKEVENARRFMKTKERLYSQKELNWLALGIQV